MDRNEGNDPGKDYIPTSPPRGFGGAAQTNKEQKTGRPDGTQSELSGQAGRLSSGYGGASQTNPESKENAQRGNPLADGIIGRGYADNNTPTIPDSLIEDCTTDRVKPLDMP